MRSAPPKKPEMMISWAPPLPASSSLEMWNGVTKSGTESEKTPLALGEVWKLKRGSAKAVSFGKRVCLFMNFVLRRKKSKSEEKKKQQSQFKMNWTDIYEMFAL